jgi:vacuolar-type H+-ATPase subunit H
VSSSDRTVRRREIEDSTAARLAEIVASAERAAKQVIDEAEEEARSRVADAQGEADRIVAERLAGLSELIEEIDAQAAALRRQAEALQRALADAKAGLDGAGSSAGPVPEGPRPLAPEAGDRKPLGPSLSIVESPRDDERRGEPGRATESQVLDADAIVSGGTPAGARLLATQMAVSGSSRAEIESRLRDGFAIKDTRSILDAILGPEQ